jgi:hypothetical protein
MNEAISLQRSRETRTGLIILAVGAMTLLIGFGSLVAYLYPKTASVIFFAGRVGDFAPASVTYFEQQHFFLVRQQNGAFLAFYDMDRRSHSAGNPRWLCRLQVIRACLAQEASVPGFETQAFQSPCGGWSAYSMLGDRVFGPSVGNLDQFAVIEERGLVKIDLTRRICDWNCDPYNHR